MSTAPHARPPRLAPPSVREVQELCQRARLAGAPGSAARQPLVADYRRLAGSLGVTPQAVPTGADLQREVVALLRHLTGTARAQR